MGAFPDAIVNAGLDARLPGTAYLAAHDAFSTTGANEVSTARTLLGMDAAVARVADNTDAETLAIPALTTVRWLGIWDAATTGTFHGMIPNGSTVAHPCVGLDTDTIYAAAHGFADNQAVVFLALNGAVPTGLTEGTVYYVKPTGKTTDTFQVTTAADDGTAVNITASAACVVSDIVEETFTAAGQLTLAAGVLDLIGYA